jgi:hypothetical protein
MKMVLKDDFGEMGKKNTLADARVSEALSEGWSETRASARVYPLDVKVRWEIIFTHLGGLYFY